MIVHHNLLLDQIYSLLRLQLLLAKQFTLVGDFEDLCVSGVCNQLFVITSLNLVEGYFTVTIDDVTVPDFCLVFLVKKNIEQALTDFGDAFVTFEERPVSFILYILNALAT